MIRAFLIVVVTTAVNACNQRTETPGIPLGQPAAETVTLSGEVLEHMAAPPYSYLRLRTATGEAWAAVSEATIERGSRVTIDNAVLMREFESRALNRTFDRIYFGSVSSSGARGGNPHAAASATIAPFDVAVEKATGPDGRTIIETWTQAAALDGRTVTVRGKVVKINRGVMGTNWIHLQDGTGDAATGTNDLTVTSQEVAAVGETVSVTGTVRTNKDFGAGYRYPVMVADAKVTRK